MSEYRIFAIGPDGRFAGEPKIVDCIDDQEAIAIYRRSRLGGLDSYAPQARFRVADELKGAGCPSYPPQGQSHRMGGQARRGLTERPVRRIGVLAGRVSVMVVMI